MHRKSLYLILFCLLCADAISSNNAINSNNQNRSTNYQSTSNNDTDNKNNKDTTKAFCTGIATAICFCIIFDYMLLKCGSYLFIDFSKETPEEAILDSSYINLWKARLGLLTEGTVLFAGSLVEKFAPLLQNETSSFTNDTINQ